MDDIKLGKLAQNPRVHYSTSEKTAVKVGNNFHTREFSFGVSVDVQEDEFIGTKGKEISDYVDKIVETKMDNFLSRFGYAMRKKGM